MRAVLLFVLLSLTSACYVTKLAWHQGTLLSSRQRIDTLLADKTTAPELREKLGFTREVLAFAADKGLRVGDAYRYYVQLPREHLSYIVQAAYADRLEAITWWFPVVGRVPYLGYFDAAERDAEALSLQEEGYDVYTSTAAAFSSLGWFEDPLYSSMLRRSKATLAGVLLHELAHRTVWIAGEAEFNEQLASFVELYLTRVFLRAQGLHEELAAYELLLDDQELYRQWLSALRGELEAFYEKAKNEDQALLFAKKRAIFERFVTELRPPFSRYDLIGDGPWNNARVMASGHYLPAYERFATAFRCSGAGNVGAFLRMIEEAWHAQQQKRQPYALLDGFCRQEKPTAATRQPHA